MDAVIVAVIVLVIIVVIVVVVVVIVVVMIRCRYLRKRKGSNPTSKHRNPLSFTKFAKTRFTLEQKNGAE